MKKLAAAALLVATLFALGFRYQNRPASFEYKVLSIKLDTRTEKTLNELGAQGWEVVSYAGYQSTGTTVDAGTFFLKRPK